MTCGRKLYRGIKQETSRFITTTSVKGVGRAYKSEVVVLRAIWTVSVVIFFGVATYQAYSQFSDYLGFPSVTYIKQEFLQSFENTDLKYGMPDLTFCNLNPYASNRNESDSITSIEEYSDLVDELTYNNPQTQLGVYFRDILKSTSGYLQYIGIEDAIYLSNTMKELVVSCKMEVFDGFAMHWINCDTYSQFKLVNSTDLLNCYTLNLDMLRVQTVRKTAPYISGFNIVLHLDNYNVTTQSYFESSYEFSHSIGALVVPHVRGTTPWITRNAIYMPAGQHSNIRLSLKETALLEPPYGTCSENVYDGNLGLGYTVRSCVSACLESIVIKKCGCKDASMMNILAGTEGYGHWPYCLKIGRDHNISAVLDHYECATETRISEYTKCIKPCPPPCLEMEYPEASSISDWPSNLGSQLFYDTHIKGHYYEDQYQYLYESNSSDYIRLVDENFVSMKVFIGDFSIMTYTDIEKTLFFSFVSSLGAGLNLWAGITVVLFIEFIEVLIRILSFKEPDMVIPDKKNSVTQLTKADQLHNNSDDIKRYQEVTHTASKSIYL